MQLFEDSIGEVRSRFEAMRGAGLRELGAEEAPLWPPGRRGEVVLRSDMAVELGGPGEESVAFLLWTSEAGLVRDGRVTLVGPDLAESAGRGLPFGKVLLLGVRGFEPDRRWERHQELELARCDLRLSGYMLRSVSRQAREWCRVSRDAVDRGLSLAALGASIVRHHRASPDVCAAEVLLATSRDEVRSLRPVAERAGRLVAAMAKVATELERECDRCSFRPLCTEVEGLRALRREGAADGRN